MRSKKRGIIIFGIILALIILFIAVYFFVSIQVSPDRLYEKSKDSLFYVEYTCFGNITYPEFSFSYDYDPVEDIIIVYTNPNNESINKTFNSFLIYSDTKSGTAFVSGNKIYTSAHIVENCTQDEFNANLRDTLQYDYDYLVIDSFYIENLTEGQVNTTFIQGGVNDILTQIQENYSTGLTRKDIDFAVSISILSYLISPFTTIELTNHSLKLTDPANNTYLNAKIASIGKSWPGKDYAILESENKFKGLSFGNSDSISIGEEIYVVGYPAAAEISSGSRLEPTITHGIVSAVKKLEAEEKYYQIDASASEGNSGGPVFNKNGKVIGILTAVSIETQGFNFFFPSNSIPRE